MKQAKPWIKKEEDSLEVQLMMEADVEEKNPRYIREARTDKKFLEAP